MAKLSLLLHKKEQRNRATPVIAPHYALGRSSPLPIPSCGVIMVANEGDDVKKSTGPSFHEQVAQVFASKSGSNIDEQVGQMFVDI